jgi:DNA-binding MarR family transcriptional regulator
MYAYICKKHHETSFSPTVRELAEMFFMSTGAVYRHLDRMEGSGWLVRNSGKARGLTLLRHCPHTESDRF